MRYPHYIVSYHTGRLEGQPLPVEFRFNPLKSMIANGRIGGSKVVEKEFQDRAEAMREYCRTSIDHRLAELLEVTAPHQSRRRIR